MVGLYLTRKLAHHRAEGQSVTGAREKEERQQAPPIPSDGRKNGAERPERRRDRGEGEWEGGW